MLEIQFGGYTILIVKLHKFTVEKEEEIKSVDEKNGKEDRCKRKPI